MDNAMMNEKLLEEGNLEEKWDIKCTEFPNKIFNYKKWEFKKIGYLQQAEYISKILYKPSFLSFYSSENKPEKSYIAVKKLKLPIDKRQAKNVLNEIKTLMMIEEKKIKDQEEINIIRLFGYKKENGCYLLYMEWMDFSLRDLYTSGICRMLFKRTLTDEIKNKLNKLIGYITVKIIDALCYLVSCEKPIIHRDVKPENILLKYTGEVKLADFGEARFENTKTTGGTPKYRPPEALKMNDIDEDGPQKYDVFSLGVVVLEYFCVMYRYGCGMDRNDYRMHPYDYIKKPEPEYLDSVVEAELTEDGELTKWDNEDSFFIKNNLINDDNFKNLLSISLRPIETRATPLELQKTQFHRVYKVENEDPRIGVATILNELEIHPKLSIISSHKAKKFAVLLIIFGFFIMAGSLIAWFTISMGSSDFIQRIMSKITNQYNNLLSKKNCPTLVTPEAVPPFRNKNDQFNPKELVILEIDRFSEFMGDGHTGKRHSQPVYISDLPWKILAIPSEHPILDQWDRFIRRKHCPGAKVLGVHLRCNDDAPDSSWSCTASVELRVHSQKASNGYIRWFTHTFNARENDYSHFITCDVR